MVIPASQMSTCLPMSWRLRARRAGRPPLGFMGPVQNCLGATDRPRAGSPALSRSAHDAPLRDELGQGLTIGCAERDAQRRRRFGWLNVTTAWMDQEWFRMGGYINLCTALQPRAPVFWDMGGWHWPGTPRSPPRRTGRSPMSCAAQGVRASGSIEGSKFSSAALKNNPTYWRL